MNSLIFVIIAIIAITFVESIKRLTKLSANNSRRLLHICAAIINILAPLYVSSSEIIIANLGFILLVVILKNKKLLTSVHSVERVTQGDLFFLVGVALSAILFLPQNILIYQFGISIMGFADPMASYFGQKFGRTNILFSKNNKTLEGSVAFFVTSILICILFFPGNLIFAVLISFTLTLVEIFSPYGSDNLTLPIIASALAALLTKV